MSEAARNLIAALKGTRDEIAERSLARIVTEYERHEQVEPAPWPPIPMKDLRAVINRLVAGGLNGVSRGEGPTSDEHELVRQLAATRARQGEPVDRILESFRIAGRELLAALEAEAAGEAVPAAAAVKVSNQIWDWLDRLMASVSQAHHEVEVSLARHDQEARLAFVRQLMAGGLSPSRLATGASFGLSVDRPHRAIRARPASGHPVDALEALLQGASRTPAIFGILDGDLVGIVQDVSTEALPVAVGVGPAVSLRAMPVSLAMASRALETALAIGRVGAVTIDELSVLPAVLAENELGEAVVARRLGPLDAHGPFGREVMESVRAYLTADQRIDVAAKNLYIHPNTLRHRLHRYQELTGTNLRRADDLVEVWWALRRTELERAG